MGEVFDGKNRNHDDVNKLILTASGRLLLVSRKVYPEHAEELKKAFNEFIATRTELNNQTGDELSIHDIERRIPNNLFLQKLREIGPISEQLANPEDDGDNRVGNIIGSVRKRKEDLD